MEETIGESAGHGAGDCPVFDAVSCREDVPSGRDFVEVAEPTVEDEFIAGDLQGAVGCGEFVEHDDAAGFGIARPFGGDQPFDAVVFRNGESAHIDGFPLCEADVDESDLEFFRDLLHHGGFSYSGRAPDHERRNHCRPFSRSLRKIVFIAPECLQIAFDHGFQSGH